MTGLAVAILLLFTGTASVAQQPKLLELNRLYDGIEISGAPTVFEVQLNKKGIYQFSILQQGVAVHYVLADARNAKLIESNYPDDYVGYEKFEYTATASGTCRLIIKRFDDPDNPHTGKISINIRSLNKEEIARRNKIKKELAPENRKHVQTADIDHFWQAFDLLSNCRSFADSVNVFQSIYLDRATNGLVDFIQVRELTAEKLTKAVARNRRHYQGVRANTYAAKKAEPFVNEVFESFSKLYPKFKPFKVCFLVGMKNTGGTVSNDYVLIGTEVTTAMDGNTGSTDDVLQKIKSIVAHECVHTQQPPHPDSTAVRCDLLYKALKEGSCDFIGQLVSGIPKKYDYGDRNEQVLWTQFNKDLCSNKLGDRLYNGSSVKGKPADLGYYIGYKISEAYYNNMSDKAKAVIDIIELKDPLKFLAESKYEQQTKN